MNEIKIVQGDDARINFSLKYASGTPYTFREGDKVIFTVRPRVKDEPVIVKEVVIDTPAAIATVTLVPSDTTTLKVGTYVYDAKLSNANGIHTFCPITDFVVVASVG